jgi:hypothetical protein
MWKYDKSTTFVCFFCFEQKILLLLLLGKIERMQRENDEKREDYPVYIITSQSQNSIELPLGPTNNKIKYDHITYLDNLRTSILSNTNQSAAVLSSTTKMKEQLSSSSSPMTIAFDPTFKIHPQSSVKRIVEL